MAIDTTHNSANHVYLAFHFASDISSVSQLTRLKHLLADTFGEEEFSEIMVDLDLTKEVIFKVNVPMIMSPAIRREFFIKLLRVFNATSQFTPHFTQVNTPKR